MSRSSTALLFLTAFCILLVTACSKDPDEPQPPAPGTGGISYGPLELWDNVVVVDDTVMVLDEEASDLATGSLVLTFNGPDPGLQPGDVIVGAAGDGYIRRISTVNVAGNTITLSTTQGYLTDVFRNGGIQFDLEMSEMDSVRSSGFSYSTGPRDLYQNGPLTVRLNQAELEMDPDWNMEMAFNEDGLTFFEFSTGNTTIQSRAALEVIANQQATLFNRTDTLNVYTKRFVRWVPVAGVPVPIVLKLDMRLMADYSAQISAAYQQTVDLSANASANVGVRYQNGGWQGIYSVTPNANLECSTVSGSVQLAGSYAWRPQMALRLYGITGPYLSVAPTLDAQGTVSQDLDWVVSVDGYLRTVLGADVQIFGQTFQPFGPAQYETSKLTFRTPQRMERISGDNQTGSANSVLPQPLRVRVFDSANRPQGNVPVYFNVVVGNGSVSPTSILADAQGYAETSWTLGDADIQIQRVEAHATWPTGERIDQTPIEFAAVAGPGACQGETTVTDIDGNTYPVVSIGSQCWMAANLKTTRYRDGSTIPNVTDNTAWTQLNTGAWCNYNNSPANDATYGKLYNWYAAANPNICPQGWHVPTDADWQQLEAALGMPAGELGQTWWRGAAQNVGGKMKTTTLWNAPNTGANNDSGFSGLPGGLRYSLDGGFLELGLVGEWWSASESGADVAWDRNLGFNNAGVDRNNGNKGDGFCVRCVRD